MKRSKPAPALISCNSCPHCSGIVILQFTISDKATGKIVSIHERAKYKCEYFDLVDEDDTCYNLRPTKEATPEIIEWIEN